MGNYCVGSETPMNLKNLNITLGKKYNAIFNGYGNDEKIQFIPVGLYTNDEGEFSIVVKDDEVISLKNNNQKKFCIEDFVHTGVFTNKNIKSIAEAHEAI
jgi:hypothetical protein